MAIAEMFSLNLFNLMSDLQNLWRLCRFTLFSLLIYPVWEPISKGITETVCEEMSVLKCSYLVAFSLCDISKRPSEGTVSSNIEMDFCFLSNITMSGFKVVTTRLGGIVPPPGVWWPWIST